MAKPNIKMPQNWALKDSNCNFSILLLKYCVTFKLILSFFSLSNREICILFLSSREGMVHIKAGGLKRAVLICIKIKGPELILLLS
jgi:hypothetical protein